MYVLNLYLEFTLGEHVCHNQTISRIFFQWTITSSLLYIFFFILVFIYFCNEPFYQNCCGKQTTLSKLLKYKCIFFFSIVIQNSVFKSSRGISSTYVYLRPKVTLHCVYTYLFLVFIKNKRKLFDSYKSPIKYAHDS